MNIYHLEDHMKNAISAADVGGVYWSARDMESFFVGNHHFFTFVYRGLQQAERVKQDWGVDYRQETNDQGLLIYFSTLGVATDTGDSHGNLIIEYNNASDIQSIHEIAKESNTSWDTPDYDYEGHRVSPAFSSLEIVGVDELIDWIMEKITNFMAHYYDRQKVSYSVLDRNCATFVNTVLMCCGYNASDREELGEFSGVDWGEEDEINGNLFKSNIIGTDTTTISISLDIPGVENKVRRRFYKQLELRSWAKNTFVSTYWYKTNNSQKNAERIMCDVEKQLRRIRRKLDIEEIRCSMTIGKYDIYSISP